MGGEEGNYCKCAKTPSSSSSSSCRCHVPSPGACAQPHSPLPSSQGGPRLRHSSFTQGWAFRANGAFYTIYLIKTPRAESSTEASPSRPRGCSRGLCLSTLCTPWAPCRAGEGRRHGTAAAMPGWAELPGWGTGRYTCTCARSRGGSMHGRVPAEVRGQGPEGVRGHGRAAPGRCARWHPTLCRDACMCVHACAALPGTTGHAKDKLGLGGGGVRAGGGLAHGELHAQHHPPACTRPYPRHVPPQTRVGVCATMSQVSGVGVPLPQ